MPFRIKSACLVLMGIIFLSITQSIAYPSSVLSTGQVRITVIHDLKYSWIFNNGAMLVSISNLPIGSWSVEARRVNRFGVEVVLGSQQIAICSNGIVGLDVEVWPVSGKVMHTDAYAKLVPLKD